MFDSKLISTHCIIHKPGPNPPQETAQILNMLQMQCLSFPPKNHPLQQKSFQPPLTYRRKSSIIECSSRSSFRLNNQIKIAVNNEGIISNRNQHKPSNGHLVPLALQDGYALQSENDHTAAATPSFLEVFKRKLIGIAHLTRPYAWINIVSCLLINIMMVCSFCRFYLEIWVSIFFKIFLLTDCSGNISFLASNTKSFWYDSQFFYGNNYGKDNFNKIKIRYSEMIIWININSFWHFRP